jgi:DNA-binding protein HU-beta
MTKSELINSVWGHKELTSEVTKKAVTEVVDCCFDVMGKTIKKDKRFSYPGFGTWTVRKRKARTGRNPQTGEAIKIAASKTVGFKPSTQLKAKL